MNTSPMLPPVQKERGIEHIDECLKFPGHRCNCWLSDNAKRRVRLRKLRNDLGLQSGLDWLDSGLVDEYERQRRQLCEGRKATIGERWQAFTLRVRQLRKK